MLLIYSKQDSNRLRYTLDIIFTRLSGIEYQLTTNAGEISSFNGPILVYDDKPFETYPRVWSSGFLFENAIREFIPKIKKSEESTVLFPFQETGTIVDFDIFSAAFYMLSRYEEYLPAEHDNYGRFPASSSLAFMNGFLEKAVVHLWTRELCSSLQNIYSEIKVKEPEYRLIPTIDVDVAFKYLHRGMMRSVGGYARSIFKGDFKSFKERIDVMSKRKDDPFDTYEYLNRLHNSYASDSRYFFLLASYGGKDKSISHSNKHFREFVKSLSSNVKSGLHPSFASANDENLLKKELRHYEEITGDKPEIARLHYLMLDLRYTYRRLLTWGILEDYTMGYADQPGFRAGIAVPFPYFDLENDKITELMIWPFTFMDGTFSDYLGMSASESFKRACILADHVRSVNGTLITLFHNETISETGRFIGWRKLYEDFIRYASPFKN